MARLTRFIVPGQPQHVILRFEQPLAEQEISEIREATNKAWVLGSDQFSKQLKKN